MPSLSRLFEPIAIGPMRVPNRIVSTTYSINSGRADGLPDEPFLRHHVARAAGGAGWIGNETWVLPTPLPPGRGDEILPGSAAIGATAFQHPDFVPRVRRFTDAVHEHGSVCVMQLTHLQSLMGPSAVQTALNSDVIPHVLDDDEIEQLLDAYPAAAAACHAAGADAVEVHCAHETLPQCFLSPWTNRRQDRWGGNLENRIRFVVEAVARIRRRVPEGLAVGLRVCADEHRDGGYRLDDMCHMAAMISEAAPVDYLSVDVGSTWGMPSYVPPMQYPVAAFAGHAAAIRRAVRVPVVYAGRVNDPEVAEQLLHDGAADLIGMTRALLADPEMPAKARAGRFSEIRKCIACNTCIGKVVHAEVKTALCAVNPEVGHEREWRPLEPAPVRKNVLVIGGGPAGLEAARVAAARGHGVTLLERGNALGGAMCIAARAPRRDALLDFPAWAARELSRLGVDVRLGVAATAEMVLAHGADAVVVATGARPRDGSLPGDSSVAIHDLVSVLSGAATARGHVVVLSEDDHMMTPSVADFLAERGARVEIVHKWLGVAEAVDRYSKGIVLHRLHAAGVRIHSSAQPRALVGRTLIIADAHTGRETRIESVDAIVTSIGMASDDALYRALKHRVAEIYCVGSAFAPRYVAEATQHGAAVGRLL
ncbi:MAG: FAD-dependent oxidoreductase [Deltaproteobacteria bacterium]|nr:FAD-dependent oxidoreductase [Deltaproteobacteria bacterium]